MPQALSMMFQVNRPFNLVPAPLVLVALCRTFPVRRQLWITDRQRTERGAAPWSAGCRIIRQHSRPGGASLSGSASSRGAARLPELRGSIWICPGYSLLTQREHPPVTKACFYLSSFNTVEVLRRACLQGRAAARIHWWSFFCCCFEKAFPVLFGSFLIKVGSPVPASCSGPLGMLWQRVTTAFAAPSSQALSVSQVSGTWVSHDSLKSPPSLPPTV